jgi:hypothetical protein
VLQLDRKFDIWMRATQRVRVDNDGPDVSTPEVNAAGTHACGDERSILKENGCERQGWMDELGRSLARGLPIGIHGKGSRIRI